MSEWQVTTLGEICQKVMTGGTPLSNNEDFYRDGTIPWLKTKEVNFCRIRETESYISELGLANSAAKVIPPNSVIIAMYGQGDTAGRVAINEIPLTTNQACCNLVVDRKIADYNFVYFYLKNSYRELVNAKTGSAQPNLNTKIIKDFPIKLPPLEEQKGISTVLVSLDRKIENLRRQNETLERIAQTLFKHWFVDFEFPNADGKPYKSSGGAMVRSELGEIPIGWRVGTLEECLEHLIDNRGKTPEFFDHGIPALSAKFVKGGDLVNRDSFNYVSHDLFEKSEKLDIGDVILTSEAPLGETYFIAKETRYYPAQRVFALRANKDIVSCSYLNYWLSSPIGQSLLKRRASGSTVQGIKQSELYQFEVLIPSREVQDRASGVLTKILNKKEMNSSHIQTLTKTRDALLPELMSGKLRVTES